jgi:GAF domain-containing protein
MKAWTTFIRSSHSHQDHKLTVNYELLDRQLDALISDEDDLLATSANFVGLLHAEIPDINWLGIYVRRGDELVLGPFQGLPACVRLAMGQGVCGTAASEQRAIRVDNVHEFDGHIACDPVSQSEVVVPLLANGEVFAVLDIDSPHEGRFSADDQAGIEKLCDRFVQRLVEIKPDLLNFI